MNLPIFPHGTKMISESVGVYEADGLVQYIANGMPIYSHDKGNLQAFYYITSNLIHQGLCRKVEIERCFGISEDIVGRNYKKFREEGESAFFGTDNRHGSSHKIVGDRLDRIQAMLDKGKSVNSIAKKESVAEGSIRYAIKKGYLKKTPLVR